MALKHMIIGRKHGKADFEPTPLKFGTPNDLRPDFKKFQASRTNPDYEEVQLGYFVKLKTYRMVKPDAKKPAPEVKPEAKKPAEEPKPKTVHFAPPIQKPAPTTHRTPVK